MYYLRQVCGLTCAHELAEYIKLGKSIPFESVDRFWRKLDMEPLLRDEVDLDVVEDMYNRFDEIVESLRSQYRKFESSRKRLLLRQAVELANPVTTYMIEPPPKINTRGHLKKGKKKQVETLTKRDPSLFEYKESMVASCSIEQPYFHISDTPPTTVLQNQQQTPKK
ncbi:hypothetical protein ACS0TY_006893 [Phlomoides rotata]